MRLWASRVQGVIAAGVVVAVIVLAVLFWPTDPSSPTGGGPANRVSVIAPFGTLTATDFVLTINGQAHPVPGTSDGPMDATIRFAGAATFGQLTIQWREGANRFVVLMHFAADGQRWWVSDIEVSDGRPTKAGWLYFPGPVFEQQHGAAFEGGVRLTSARSTYAETGVLTFGELTLTAFTGGDHRDPTSGRMPESNVIGPNGPDFVPMISGSTLAGFVSVYWNNDVPITSFEGQPPDQPVFGPDLRTVVGYSVPGIGFMTAE
jgi:hypothetical protein